MQQIRIFKSIESEVTDLERQINGWIQESGARVIHMFGNIAPQTVISETAAASGRAFSPSDIMIIVLYETD